jgi:glycerol-3-phosphate cytidylyltransferase
MKYCEGYFGQTGVGFEMKLYKTGYTTGVFDLFHIGHLNLIKRAKEQCEYLIVGVSTDELAQSYKNRKPCIPFAERMEIVKSIRYVDQVVPQESREKIRALKTWHFDVMFLGDDWKGNAVYEKIEAELDKHGVSVVYFPRTRGISTTEVMKRLERTTNIRRDQSS